MIYRVMAFKLNRYRRKNLFWIYLLIAAFILFFSCKKEKNIIIEPINFNPLITYGIVKDQDGNAYKTVNIGNKVWMAENLRTTKFNDNKTIPLVKDSTAWSNLITPGYCCYDNDAETYLSLYGALYNWYAVNAGKLCPAGWHVPSDEEWITLRTYLGGEELAGGKMKESGISHWQSPNAGATNQSGFTAIPGGMRGIVGTGNEWKFGGLGTYCSWWSATRLSSEPFSLIFGFRIHTDYSRLFRNEFYMTDGVNVRCIKD
jgi:uncharacterized protein (TIGR02145 family)